MSQALDWRTKGLPPAAEGSTPETIGQLGLNLLAGDLMMPAAVLRETALKHNIAAMQAFADRSGAHLCPHGKTSMSPELFAMQLEAGAWGLTAATAHHVRIYRRLGIKRIFLANELAGRADVAFILSEIAADPLFDFYALVDSADGVSLLAAASEQARCPRPIQLLIETGAKDGRAGVRNAESASDLARRVKAAEPWLALRGIESFEGIQMARGEARDQAATMLHLARESADRIAAEGLFSPGAILLSAGGSAFLDIVMAELPGDIAGHELQQVIRPGCYVTHDDGIYERLTKPGGKPFPTLPDLEPALEVWGTVLSIPEPDRVIVGVGKRDASHDIEPPRPLWLYRNGDDTPIGASLFEVISLWDQHLSLAGPTNAVTVGDLVGFGISHPCATFDRWQALLLVDDAYRITGAVTTLF